jgi:hypothetical protein
MKAVLFHQHGSLDVLEYSDFPTPEPKPGEVLVRLRAAALNRLDIWVRNGWPGIRLEYPHIPGADGAGEIAALGEGISGWQIDDPVAINANLGCGTCDQCQRGSDNLCRNWNLLGETVRGAYAEYISLPVRQLFRLPNGFDFRTAAAAGLVYLTAWHSLVTRARLAAGESVLVVGASGAKTRPGRIARSRRSDRPRKGNGWEVRMNEQPISLIKQGNWLAANAPAGRNIFVFRYLPWDVPLGITLSFIGIFLCFRIWMQNSPDSKKRTMDGNRPQC